MGNSNFAEVHSDMNSIHKMVLHLTMYYITNNSQCESNFTGLLLGLDLKDQINQELYHRKVY